MSAIEAAETAEPPVVMIALDPRGRVLMRRDLQLVKEIALRVQAKDSLAAAPVTIEGYEPWIVERHVELMVHAGLLDVANVFRPMNGLPVHFVRDLTNDGHDFVGSIQNDTVWNRLKALFPAEELQKTPLKIVAAAASRIMELYVMSKIGGGP